MTFSLPAPPLSEGETRSGGLLLALPHKRHGRAAAAAAGGEGFLVVPLSCGLCPPSRILSHYHLFLPLCSLCSGLH